MKKPNLYYEDTVVAPGSDLYEALEKGKIGLAKQIYEQTQIEAQKLLKKSQRCLAHMTVCPTCGNDYQKCIMIRKV